MDNCKHIVWTLDAYGYAVEGFMRDLGLDYFAHRDPLVQYAGFVRESSNEIDWILGIRKTLGLCEGCSGTCPEVGFILALIEGQRLALEDLTATCVVPVNVSV